MILYSTGCPKCNVLKKKMAAVGINYIEINDPAAIKEKGIVFVPVLEVNDKLYNFKEAVDYINNLNKGD